MHGRRLLIDRVTAGRPVAHVAAELGISRATGHKRIRRRATTALAELGIDHIERVMPTTPWPTAAPRRV
ncbi:leucine zipper domain-containing protein [Amycolatopsis sp. FBCC-B4732]|nr:leucine zipper domain-containing protein [Amycolatopsis sp. FBCC-B4732]UOX93494.1 leucine zipper domain-containing protein [Amycolatopsis sp. FBCC-B4732]